MVNKIPDLEIQQYQAQSLEKFTQNNDLKVQLQALLEKELEGVVGGIKTAEQQGIDFDGQGTGDDGW